MSSDSIAIRVSGVGKDYAIFEKPSHRLWQMLMRGKRQFFREHAALLDVTFDVRRGETVGIVGRNGSGKSTLLSIICGTLPASRGSVVVQGKVAALLELGAGFNPELSGRENIDLCAQIYGLPLPVIEQRRESIIAFADIGEYIDHPVKTYSSGMFTRLAFAVVAHVDAEVLVVDEALAVGDAYFVQKCMRFLHDFRRAGGTLLFVSHDMGSVTSLCDRAIWLRGGGVEMDDTPKRVAQGYLADLYSASQSDADADVRDASVADVPPGVGATAAIERYDPRRDLVLASNLRNDLEVFAFQPGHDFGTLGADVVSAAFVDSRRRPLAWVVGGEEVGIELVVKTRVVVDSLIVGFVVKDRNGQPLFGDNTCLTTLGAPVRVDAGGKTRVVFRFQMPILPVGDYAVSVAVSDGDQREHTVLQWIHDALIISSHSSSVAHGLVGVPMRSIEIEASPLEDQ